MDVKDQVYQIFVEKGEMLKSAQIADMLQVDKKLVDKAIQSLKKEEKIFSPKVCFYQAK